MNKKIILSLLTLGMLAVVASAGTWAYYQDTLTSANNQIQTANFLAKYSTDPNPSINSNWKFFGSDGTASTTVSASSLNVAPDGDTYYPFFIDGNLGILNADGTPLDVWAKATVTSTVPMSAMSVKADGKNIITNGESVGLVKLTDASLGPLGIKNCALTYNFKNDPNTLQNSQAGQTFKFDVKLYVVPAGTVQANVHTT